MTKNRQRFYRVVHRRLGLVFSIFILMAAGSGVFHNVMTWTQSAPPPPLPGDPPDWSAVTITPSEAMTRAEVDAADVRSVAIRQIGGRPYYQCLLNSGPPVYVNASNGERSDDADTRYAEEVASNYLGGSEVSHDGILNAFDREYIVIYRLLPVHRITVADGKGTRLYVSTVTGSVARHTDDAKQLESNVFSLLHKFQFIRNKNLRNGLLTVTTAGMALAGLSGIVLFGLTRPRKA